MDKEKVIELTKGNSFSLEVIYDYCIEMGKDELLVSKLITALAMSPFGEMIKRNYYFEALDYYQRKYNISILKDKDGRILNAF